MDEKENDVEMDARKLVPRLSRRAWIITGAAAVVLIGGGVWLFSTLLPSQAAAETVTRTQAASLETLQQTVSASGTVTPTVNDEVNFTVSGTVTEVAVAEGDVVEQGAVLVGCIFRFQCAGDARGHPARHRRAPPRPALQPSPW